MAWKSKVWVPVDFHHDTARAVENKVEAKRMWKGVWIHIRKDPRRQEGVFVSKTWGLVALHLCLEATLSISFLLFCQHTWADFSTLDLDNWLFGNATTVVAFPLSVSWYISLQDTPEWVSWMIYFVWSPCLSANMTASCNFLCVCWRCI